MRKALAVGLVAILVHQVTDAKTTTDVKNPCLGCGYIAQDQNWVHWTGHVYHIENDTNLPQEYGFCYDDIACWNNKDMSKWRKQVQCQKIVVQPHSTSDGMVQMNFTVKFPWTGWCRFRASNDLYTTDGKIVGHSSRSAWFEVTRWGQGRVSPNDAPQDGDG